MQETRNLDDDDESKMMRVANYDDRENNCSD